MTGIWKACDLTKRVSALESSIRLFRYFRDRLKYLQPGVTMLVEAAVSSEEFTGLEFLRMCDFSMKNGGSFRESWRAAVLGSGELLGRESAKIVAELGGVLGASDLDSQLSWLEYGISLLELKLSDAREYERKHKRLYQTLGVLGGAGIAVFLA